MDNITRVRAPKDLLAIALRELRIGAQAKLTFARFPDLGAAAEGMAWYLTSRVPFLLAANTPSTLPLLHLCFKWAFEWMNFAATKPGATVRDAQTTFLAGLMYHAPEIMHCQVVLDGEAWDPFHDEALAEWLPKHPGAEMIFHDGSAGMADPEIRMAILTRIFPNGALARLDADISQVLFPPEEFHPPKELHG